MMLPKRLFTSLAMILLFASCLLGQASTPIFPLSEVRPGLKGVGRTIFEGDKIEDFQVEILGVLKNALAPKRDLILARLAGGPLAITGVISGMSGSPVYVDGKLVGAVSRAFPLSKGAIAGITPIEEMLTVSAAQAPTTANSSPNENIRMTRVSGGLPEFSRVIPDENLTPGVSPLPAQPETSGTSLSTLLLPVRFGGFSGTVINQFAPQFRRLGLEPTEGGMVAGSPQDLPASSTDLLPGSMISLLLVRGDLNMNIDCTVTLRQGNSLYACGHQVLAQGPAQFPFAPAHVIVTVPSIASSFKVDAPGAVVGIIQQDRFDAIYGQVSDKTPPMIPVHVQLASTQNRKSDYNFDILNDPFLSPILLNLAATSTLTVTERSLGASTLNVKAGIHLSDGRTVNLEDVLSGDAGTLNTAGPTVAAPLAMLMASGFPDLKIHDIDLSLESLEEKRTASIEDVWCSKSEVRPGDHLEVTVLLHLPGGKTMAEKIPVEVPVSITDKMLQLVVGGGAAINSMEFRFSALGGTPRDSHQLVRALNRMRRNNRVYALLMTPQRSFVMRGDEYPSPPPSLVQMLMTDPASMSTLFSGTSMVGDYETKPTAYAITGQKTLILKVTGL
jgi:hypothetical protein